jgi:hypothetical protein
MRHAGYSDRSRFSPILSKDEKSRPADYRKQVASAIVEGLGAYKYAVERKL